MVALWGNKYKNSLTEITIIDTAVLQSACDLRQAPCTAIFVDGETVTLEVSPKSIPLLEPLRLIVSLEGNSYSDPSSIDVQFEGINMEMPFVWTTLTQLQPPSKLKREYNGKAILPVCSLQRMKWEARVSIKTPKGMKVAVFPFYTLK